MEELEYTIERFPQIRLGKTTTRRGIEQDDGIMRSHQRRTTRESILVLLQVFETEVDQIKDTLVQGEKPSRNSKAKHG